MTYITAGPPWAVPGRPIHYNNINQATTIQMPVQSTQRKPGKQLTDIEIAKALGCTSKAGAHQRTIAEWLKGTKTSLSVQRALSMYSFDTFQGRNPRREYQRITTQREDRYIER